MNSTDPWSAPGAKKEHILRKRIKQTTAALCMSIVLLTNACGSEQTEVQDESVVETIDKGKIEIEIAHDGRVELEDTLQKIADGRSPHHLFYIFYK